MASVLMWVAMPDATAATRVDLHSGMLNCSGTMTVMVQNMTGRPLDATVIARSTNGQQITPSGGSAQMDDIPVQSTDFLTYDCAGGANRAIHIKTTSTLAIAIVQFTNIGGGTQTVTANDWRVRIRR